MALRDADRADKAGLIAQIDALEIDNMLLLGDGDEPVKTDPLLSPAPASGRRKIHGI